MYYKTITLKMVLHVVYTTVRSLSEKKWKKRNVSTEIIVFFIIIL